ncbi:MAG: DNA repair protein RecO [Paracoccaceae bacterium]|nr:DNA repair protein RecO [Paracoccaceae bacterium]
MDWRETGVLIAARRHGETAQIIEVFTKCHGRHAGVVPGGASRKMAPVLQPGAELDLTWRARLADHIGTFRVEPVRSRAHLMEERLTLAALNAVAGLLAFALPEREPHPVLYEKTVALLDMIGEGPVWPLAYLRWELSLLDELGFGLDLSRCAATGATEGLAYVSPKTGRAVSEAGAGAWKDRLLPLSPDLLGQGTGEPASVVRGLKVTGHFVSEHLAPALGERPVPAARARFVDTLGRQ